MSKESSLDWLGCSELRRNPVSSEQGHSTEGLEGTDLWLSLF